MHHWHKWGGGGFVIVSPLHLKPVAIVPRIRISTHARRAAIITRSTVDATDSSAGASVGSSIVVVRESKAVDYL